MILGAFCDLLIDELGYATVDKKIDRRVIIVRADAVRSELLAAGNYDATMVNGNWQYNIADDLKELPDQLFISRAAEVKFSTSRGKFYSDMPTSYISFKNKSGIRIVHGLLDNSGSGMFQPPVAFMAQRAGENVAFNLLESTRLLGGIGYEIEGQQIFYNNMASGTYNNALITYMPALTGLQETDELPISGEFINLLLDKTKQAFLLQKQIPENKTNDNLSE